MSSKIAKTLRCAIYTRKSTEHGLELEFNSLDAQREACAAYIKSQASEGWRLVPTLYDDPAYSGGNMERPALQRLLKDVEAGLVDVIVVYKIDRLTRSLADFAKLVEVFEAKSVSFVAITQQFNTTTSMGRLTLNVLLSFAQFERELSSERVRDKVAAARKKGKWTGGSVPLGYDTKDKRLVINTAEAQTVRMIFARYLTLRSFQRLIDELNERRIVTKKRPTKDGTAGGVRFTYGPLAYLLKNRTYLGEIGHKNSWYPGEHQPVIDRDTFEQVQTLLKTNSEGRAGHRHRNGALLAGLLFDDRGNRLSPSFSVKNGVRYPFYVNSALLRGQKDKVGAVRRVSAQTIETLVLEAAKRLAGSTGQTSEATPAEVIQEHVERIVIGAGRIRILPKAAEETAAPSDAIDIPWSPKPKSAAPSTDAAFEQPDPDRAELLPLLVRAHIWLNQLRDGTYSSVEELAKAADLHPKVIRKGIRMAFISPEITRDILQGKPPRLLQSTLQDVVPLRWSQHREVLLQ